MTYRPDFPEDASALSGVNATFIEHLYERFLKDPESVEETWREQFRELQRGAAGQKEVAHSKIRRRLVREAKEASANRYQTDYQFTLSEENIRKQSAVARLINHYRMRGHQGADNNPLEFEPKPPVPDLELGYFGLKESDLDTVFDTGTLAAPDKLPLREILAILRETYCGSIGSEYMHIVDTDINGWIKYRLENCRARLDLDDDRKRGLLGSLTAAECLEKHLHQKYVGQKRFSLEGGESLIPLLDETIQRAGEQGIKEIVIGMAHRGRLNVLINILGKNPAALFGEFEGKTEHGGIATSGDVKYHQGFSSDVMTPGGAVHLALSFNPSHLECINPVVEGSVRARQDRLGEHGQDMVLPLLLHGDASFAGQGIVMETLNMAETPGYTTGGTVHVVINNQIGFTTSAARDARSTLYCTDVAHMVQAPVFHVNADDPEAVLFVTRLALDYRMTFRKDVVIDLICYRRHGHNEADEPAATQPMMYRFIRGHPGTRKIYAGQLTDEGVIDTERAEALERDYHDALERGATVSRPIIANPEYAKQIWTRYQGQDWETPAATVVPLDTLRALGERWLALPPGFTPHPRLATLLESRRAMLAGKQPLDWGCAENLAYAALLAEGRNVRLTGQDCERGTFFHRHAVIHDQNSGATHTPLRHLAPDQGRLHIHNSLLSEEGVLGFEYGYASAEPETLEIWEAQFGDFANNAQVLIDQFISSGEAKWGRLCGLTLLLPHGYEGQGPEHSSARLERYLQLCAELNMQVCAPTTPAQIFHLLRRQLLRPFRKPLIVMSPKSLLRHPLAASPLNDLATGGFQPVIDEVDAIDRPRVERVVLCAGKIYYDLLEARRARNASIALMRIEQLYPFPAEHLRKLLAGYPALRELVWCQEEPENQGAWYEIRHRFQQFIGAGLGLKYAGRARSAAPATGSHKAHVEQQEKLLEDALD
jgi:2-oxoglutarate dehydrogenase E1 component